MLSFIDSTEHLLLLKVTWHSYPNTSIFINDLYYFVSFPDFIQQRIVGKQSALQKNILRQVIDSMKIKF